jgi:Tfp pilus assembly protein PilV
MNRNLGQSIFEVIIAIGVIAVVLVTLVSLMVTAQRNTNIAKDRSEASRLAQELTEWLRGQRDASWGNFYTQAGTSPFCFNTLDWTHGGTCGDYLNSRFRREASFVRVDPNRVTVTIRVSWSDSAGTHDSQTQTIFTNWRRG